MSLPCFYISVYDPASPEIALDEESSRHVVQVLRMKPGEPVRLTDGRGHLLEGEITEAHKKRCRVAVRGVQTIPPPSANVTIAISPLKNASRFEWFLEKAAEIGVSTIIPLICERTERQSIRTERLRNILISAMLQSQQAWLPLMPEPQPFSQVVGNSASPTANAQAGEPLQNVHTGGDALAIAGAAAIRLVAHCLEVPRTTHTLASVVRERLVRPASTAMAQPPTHPGAIPTPGAVPGAAPEPRGALILIGPEGDFTAKEVEMALAAGYLPISLGQNRLRTETAGVVAATLLCIH
jgi:16S rRNA (uracil1498-N3)-methyltransferase